MLRPLPDPGLPPRLALLLAIGACLPAVSQPVTLPPSGENQKAVVTQFIGPVSVTIEYSSPDVTGPQGTDRRGAIWGELVPWGMNELGFGSAEESPWRAGANENTTFTVSHDVEVQGQDLDAGTYGLHMIPRETEPWTIVFSHNSTTWGSFFYDPEEDALRVEATPEEAPFREWLTYEFIGRQPSRATVALHWEELRIPFTITVPDRDQLYLAKIRRDLQNTAGFSWQGWNAAANFALTNGLVTEETLDWAETAVSGQFIGQENFATLVTKARVQRALDDPGYSATLDRAIRHSTAAPGPVHNIARTFQTQDDLDEAIRLFKLNAELHGDAWPVHVGLARAYSAEGDYEKALEHARRALDQAPDPANRQNLEQIIQILEAGRDFNPTN